MEKKTERVWINSINAISVVVGIACIFFAASALGIMPNSGSRSLDQEQLEAKVDALESELELHKSALGVLIERLESLQNRGEFETLHAKRIVVGDGGYDRERWGGEGGSILVRSGDNLGSIQISGDPTGLSLQLVEHGGNQSDLRKHGSAGFTFNKGNDFFLRTDRITYLEKTSY